MRTFLIVVAIIIGVILYIAISFAIMCWLSGCDENDLSFIPRDISRSLISCAIPVGVVWPIFLFILIVYSMFITVLFVIKLFNVK